MAILLKFRKEFRDIMMFPVNRSGEHNGEVTKFMVLGTIFTAVTGIPAYFYLFRWFSENPEGGLFTLLIGFFLVITGIVLIIGSRMERGMRRVSDLIWVDGALTGLAQGFAVLPGISRSGFTVVALLGRRVEKSDALRLSFLLDVPAIFGAMVLTYWISLDRGAVFTLPMGLAIIVAFVLSYFSMSGLIALARRIDLSRFCILYGSLAAGAAAVQILI